jgi:hypothetical protein
MPLKDDSVASDRGYIDLAESIVKSEERILKLRREDTI